MKGSLYIVATPIGNLGDITLRAVETLKSVDFIACEDTRTTKRLLDHYSIAARTVSYHQHSRLAKLDFIVSELLSGKNIAVVTDAGTPGISDPGNILVAEAIKNNISIVPIPGPSAVMALASVSGIDMARFCYFGYAPHKKGRETFFKEIVASKYPVAYYDSVHRILKNLELLQKIECEKNIIVGRELTKMFEEIIRGSIGEAIRHFQQNPDRIKGEFAIIIYEK